MLAVDGVRAREASVIDVDADSDTTEDLKEADRGRQDGAAPTLQQPDGDAAPSRDELAFAAGDDDAESDDDDDPKLVMVAPSASPTSSIESARARAPLSDDGDDDDDDERYDALTFREQLRHRMVGDAEKARNSAFFTSIHTELLQTPQKVSLKRPLALRESLSSRSLWGGDDRRARLGGGVDARSRIERGPHASHSDSSSDMAVDEEEEQKHEDAVVVDMDSMPTLQQIEKRAKKQHHRELNFFMREPQQAFPSVSRQQSRVCASRTRICGRMFGRCELLFSESSVELVLWRRHSTDDKDAEKTKSETRHWRGTLEYDHLQRFCFHVGASEPPYLLLLEVRASEEAHTSFSEFYDSIYAKFAQDRVQVPRPNLYGAAFYFDKQVDFVRCKSMAESFVALSVLFSVPISDDEAAAYTACAMGRSGDAKDHTAASGTIGRETRRRSSVVSAFTGGVKNAVNAVSSFFGQPTLAPLSTNAQTAESASTAIKRDSMGFFRQPAPHANAVVEIDDPTQPSWSSTAVENQAVPNNDDDPSSRNAAHVGDRESATEPPANAKAATLLTYPYGEFGDSKHAGKISVTYGDIARLAPGEFLNDSIIDFYLRFLWRHLESWQQECVYMYSSHFFTQLSGSGALTPDERFARVSRWTLKESDLFEKRFLFIPINDSFHWSVAVFCNPGSAIIQKRKRLQQVVVSQNGDVSTRRRIALENGEPIIVDLVDDNFSYFRRENGRDQGDTARSPPPQNESVEVKEEYVEEELEITEQNRQQHPPCLLFLDSLRCHRKKKFTAMLREYLDCEWKSRLPGGHESVDQKTAESIVPSGIDDESIVTYFDADSITLLEPEIPLQMNSSDCGVFLLMYAAEVLRRFPAGIMREDVETNFSTTLTSEMFDGEHVLEFRDYLHQLIFCLQSLQKRGLSEHHVQDEELDTFTIDR